MFDDQLERYSYMMECGKNATTFPEEYRIDDFKVPGCVSQVWLVPKFENGKVTYLSDSDAFITKGTVTILCDVFSGHTPKEIVDNISSTIVVSTIMSLITIPITLFFALKYFY